MQGADLWRDQDVTQHWFAVIHGRNWWLPDIYAAKTDAAIDDMACGVPDCTSDTPGING